MARYHQTGEWRERASRQRDLDLGDGRVTSAIVVEVSDLHDTRTGHTYRDGTYRVRLVGIPGWRTKTFRGESAHHAAASYAHDVALDAFEDWRWWPDL